MALFEQWEKFAEEKQHSPDAAKFWQDYFQTEKNIYIKILKAMPENDTVKGFAEKFGVDLLEMTGFLDGINDSLKVKNPLETLTEDSEVNLEYEPELLYKNMIKAKADWLFQLPEWEALIAPERQKELYKEQKQSTTVVKAEKIGRNDPCACGSGKKYKKCCGRDV